MPSLLGWSLTVRVDGANVIQRFFNVTLPCLRPTMFFVTVMLTINSFKIFDLILVMTDGVLVSRPS